MMNLSVRVCPSYCFSRLSLHIGAFAGFRMESVFVAKEQSLC